jgi:amidase
VEDAAVRLAQAGAVVRECVLPAPVGAVAEVRDVINDYERARAMAWEWAHHGDRLSARLSAVVQRGFEIPHETYVSARRLLESARAMLAAAFDSFDVLLAPCVAGEAPEGLDHTGDTRFQAFWTMLHVPTVCLPTHTGPHGLPVAIQIVGPAYEDVRLLDTVRWIWRQLGSWEA